MMVLRVRTVCARPIDDVMTGSAGMQAYPAAQFRGTPHRHRSMTGAAPAEGQAI